VSFQFVEKLDGLVNPTADGSGPKVLVITKAGKFLRGQITDHNVRVNSDGRLRGRLVMQIDGAQKEVDANDITSLEKV